MKALTRSAQFGISLVGAIFFITVVALLTMALTRSVATSAQASTVDVQRLRAFLAAETGAQLGAHAALPPQGSAQCTDRTIALDSFGQFECEAHIACRSEIVSGNRYFTIQSNGRCMDGGQLAAERTVLLRLRET